MIAHASRTLENAEQNYCVTRKEMLAVVFFTKYYKHYLLGRHFILRTNHGSLRGRTGLVVRASDSGSGDPGSILGRVGVLFP